MTKIEEQLIKHEGIRLTPYWCSRGYLTIGVGRNLEGKGITEAEAIHLLNNDIKICIQDLLAIFNGQFKTFPENIQMVLIDMRFQLGHSGFRRFKKMIVAVKNCDWDGTIKEMINSKWYNQVKGRADNLISMIKDQ